MLIVLTFLYEVDLTPYIHLIIEPSMSREEHSLNMPLLKVTISYENLANVKYYF